MLPYVSRRELSEGVTLKEDVFDPHGRLLIGGGTVLNSKHLRALGLWGISAVHVELERDDDQLPGTFALPPEILEEAENQAKIFFVHNMSQKEHPVIKQLFASCVSKIAKNIESDGKNCYDKENIEEGLQMRPDLVESLKADWTVEKLINETKTIASLPSIYQELVQVVYHPRSSAADVGKVICSDPGLTSRLLRIVNSALYGFSRRIDTVGRAIAIIGTNELCDLALATSVIQGFKDVPCSDEDVENFWHHSLWCAVVARLLATHRRDPNTERFFVAGLLHDIGKLIMLVHMPETISAICNQVTAKEKLFFEVERELLGFDHGEIGGALLNTWNLPENQSNAVRDHHAPVWEAKYGLETSVVHVADIITTASCVTIHKNLPIPALNIGIWDHLEIDANVLPSIIEGAQMQVESISKLLGLR